MLRGWCLDTRHKSLVQVAILTSFVDVFFAGSRTFLLLDCLCLCSLQLNKFDGLHTSLLTHCSSRRRCLQSGRGSGSPASLLRSAAD